MSLNFKLSKLNDLITPELPFLTAYGPKLRVTLDEFPLSLTQQHFKDECDINVLMQRYQQTGILDGRDPTTARYMDVSDYQAIDFQTAQNFIREAHDQFYQLPAQIRDRFFNDPGRLISFMEDPSNAKEAISLGLLRDPTLPTPTVPLGASAPSDSSSALQPAKT